MAPIRPTKNAAESSHLSSEHRLKPVEPVAVYGILAGCPASADPHHPYLRRQGQGRRLSRP